MILTPCTPCTSCGRKFRSADPRLMRCQGCRERAKVYQHQLHLRRGYMMRPIGGRAKPSFHSCELCRKHKKHVERLIERWDQRGIYLFEACPKGHRWFKWKQHERCQVCSEISRQQYIADLRRQKS